MLPQPVRTRSAGRTPRRRGSDALQLAGNASVDRSTAREQRRAARWSRTRNEGRVAQVDALERQLNESMCELEDDMDEEGGGSPGGKGDGEMEMSGFLVKKTGTFSNYKRRFFVLRGGTLLWYKSEKDTTPTGFAHLADATVAEARSSTKEGYHFSLSSQGKTYALQTDDASDRDRWLRALRHNKSVPAVEGCVTAGTLETPHIGRHDSVGGWLRGRRARLRRLSSSRLRASSMDSERASGIAGQPGANSWQKAAAAAKAAEAPDKKKTKHSLLSSLTLRIEKRMVGFQP